MKKIDMDSWGFFVFALVFLAFIFAVLFAIIGTDAVPSEKTAVKAEREPASVAGVFFQGGKEIVRGNTEKNQVIFTFDGGDTDQSAEKILNVLEKHKVKGTFFLTGKFVENYPELVKRIAAQGEEIFSHTYDHKDLETLSDGEITAELTMMETVLGNTVHISPKPFFRAPYGSRDGRVLSVAEKAGYQSVYWTVDTLDWEEPQGRTAAEVEDRILSNISPGAIFLMHLGNNLSGEVLDDVFTKIESRGYKIVSLTEGIR